MTTVLLAAAVALATLAPAGELCLYDCGTVCTPAVQCSAVQRRAATAAPEVHICGTFLQCALLPVPPPPSRCAAAD